MSFFNFINFIQHKTSTTGFKLLFFITIIVLISSIIT